MANCHDSKVYVNSSNHIYRILLKNKFESIFQVVNEKINHCIELTELVSSNLNDKHHVRLEWMIIVLIMVEVAFETMHYIRTRSVLSED